MSQIVEIPGIGEVEFPADMPAAQVQAEVEKLIANPQQAAGAPAKVEVGPIPLRPAASAPAAPTQAAAPSAPPRRQSLAEKYGVPPELRDRFDEYERILRAEREQQSLAGRYAGTAVRGVARAVPFMDDIAAYGDTIIGRGVGNTFGERRMDNLLRQRALNASDDEDRPITSYGGQIGGAFALPGAAYLRGGTLLDRTRRAATVGAGYGAAAGFGAGYDPADRFSRATSGAVVGGVLGGVLPGAGAGVGKASDAISYVTQPAREAIRSRIAGARNPQEEAMRRVRAAMERDRAAGSRGISPDDRPAASAAGQDAVVADFGGETTRALARSAANTSPEAREALVGRTADRFQQQGERGAQYLTRLFDLRGDPATMSEQIRAAARSANRPLYERAYAEGDALWGGTLEELTRSPMVQRVMREAERRANDATAAFTDAPVVRNPFVLDEATGQMVLRGAADGSYALPNLAYWDLVKRGIDDIAQGLPRGTDERRTAEQLARRLRDELDARVPSYAEARGMAARFFGVDDAFSAGQTFARTGMPSAERAAEFRQMLGRMRPEERQFFAQGYGMEVVQTALNARDTVNVTTRLFGSPQARSQLHAVLGPERTRELEGYIYREQIMDRLRNAVQGNSTTARQLQELGLAGGAGAGAGYMVGGSDPTSITMGAVLGAAIRRGAGGIDERVSREVGRILSSNDPNVIAQLLGRIGEQPGGEKTLRLIATRVQQALPAPQRPAGAPAALGAPQAPPSRAAASGDVPVAPPAASPAPARERRLPRLPSAPGAGRTSTALSNELGSQQPGEERPARADDDDKDD